MVNFDDLLSNLKKTKSIHPKEIFEDNIKNEKFQYLRSGQEKILSNWFNNRAQKDTIIKMNTGGGKTTVGLLQLQSSLNEGIQSAAFLCLDNQLVNQVMAAGSDLGIKCVTFDSSSFPVEFLNGEAILVTTFKKLFNAKSKFGIHGDTAREPTRIGALVVDDAHAALTQARESFTLKINSPSILFNQLLDLFKDDLIHQAKGTANDILEHLDPYAIMMVPYWSWLDKLDQVYALINKSVQEESDLKFQWNLIRNYLELCDMFISSSTIEISPKCLPINMIPSYDRAERRIFMSATLNDDSSLITDFNIDKEAILNPLQADSFTDIGDKLILAPFNIDKDLNTEKVASILNTSNGINTVVLVSSLARAEYWTKKGYIKPSPEEIIPLMSTLKNSKDNKAVFSNRYDGIDLADDSCRILVLDGIPTVNNLAERFLLNSRPTSKIMQFRQAQKIEQGLGRAVRSINDYAVVLLLGADLIQKISTKQFHEFMTPQTVSQIKLGTEIVNMIKNSSESSEVAIKDAMIKVLTRDRSWIGVHKGYIDKTINASRNIEIIENSLIEREAFNLALSNQYLLASEKIRNNLSKLSNGNISEEGWYMQLAATYLYKTDKADSSEIQITAHRKNNGLLKPLNGLLYQKILRKQKTQALNIKKNIEKYESPNSMILNVEQVLSGLVFSPNSHTKFEKCFADLGTLLGFSTQQPDKQYNIGPDCIWDLLDDSYLVIEAKNEVLTTRKEILKSETEQISEAMNWFNYEYSNKKGLPLIIHPALTLHSEAFGPENLKILNEEQLEKFKSTVRNFYAHLVTVPKEKLTLQYIQECITTYKLNSKSINELFKRPIKK